MVNCFSIGNHKPRPGIVLLTDSLPRSAILNGIDRFSLKAEPKEIPESNLYDLDAIAALFAGQETPWVGETSDGQLILYACDIGERGTVKPVKQNRYIYVHLLGGIQNEMYSLGDSDVFFLWFNTQNNTQEILLKMNPNSSAIALGGMVVEYRGNGRFVSS